MIGVRLYARIKGLIGGQRINRPRADLLDLIQHSLAIPFDPQRRDSTDPDPQEKIRTAIALIVVRLHEANILNREDVSQIIDLWGNSKLDIWPERQEEIDARNRQSIKNIVASRKSQKPKS
jgi:hypothetical protein